MRQGAANDSGSRLALSFDVGGTFTDFTLVDLATGRVIAEHKTLTDPVDPAASSLAGWRDLVADGRLRPEELAFVVHATTLVTNAVIERKGAPTALLTTAGFRDLLTFGREQMYDIYDLFAPPAEPLVPRDCGSRSTSASTGDGRRSCNRSTRRRSSPRSGRWSSAAPTAVAIGFLHSYLVPAHEEQAATAIAAAFPDLDVSLSSRVAPLIGEYERFSTTVADAYVKGRVRSAIGGLTDALHGAGMPRDRTSTSCSRPAASPPPRTQSSGRSGCSNPVRRPARWPPRSTARSPDATRSSRSTWAARPPKPA